MSPQSLFLSGGLPIHQVPLSFTDAQIKAAPTTPLVLVPPTEILNFSGIPTRIILPTSAIFILDSRGGAYTNIGNATIEMIFGAADRINAPASLAEPLAEVSVTWMSIPFPEFSVQAGALDVPFFFLLDNYEDNGLRLKLTNAGDFTGGNAANNLKVSLAYYIFNTSTGEFE